MVPAYYDIDNDLRSDDDMADLKQVMTLLCVHHHSHCHLLPLCTVYACTLSHATTGKALHAACHHLPGRYKS
jgi:hypothetical protein